MTIRDTKSERLYVTADLARRAEVLLDDSQAHYLVNVLRMGAGDKLLVFNGRDGEWRAELKEVRKRNATLDVLDQTRVQTAGPDVDYLFAPLKRARLDYLVQKATELGVARLRPVITDRTVAERVNTDRMLSNVIEAAQQCGILRVPAVFEPVALNAAIETWDESRQLIFCDEAWSSDAPIATLQRLSGRAVAVLVGPEGGFSERERETLLLKPFVTPLSLGPRIMRADTAAVAALAVVNAVIGDWR